MAGANSDKKKLGLILAIAAASLMAAIFAYSSLAPVQQAEAKDTLDRVVVTKTVTSIQDSGAGHASHQVAMFLPPLG